MSIDIESIIEELENICYTNEYVLDKLAELKNGFYELAEKLNRRADDGENG